MKEPFKKEDSGNESVKADSACANCGHQDHDVGRRSFLAKITLGVGALSALTVGGVLASSFVGPSLRKKDPVWIPAGLIESLPVNEVTTVNLRYKQKIGFYEQENLKPVMIWRKTDEVVVYDSRCTHLGCAVHWDAGQKMFLCACHGGAFELDGTVKTGPPPRPLDRLQYKVEGGNILIALV